MSRGFSMNCRKAREHLALHPDASEAPDVRASVDAHLQACPACAAEARRLAAAWGLLDAWVDTPTAADLVPRLRALPRSALVASRRSRSWRPLAAAAALLIAAAALLLRPSRPVEQPAPVALTPAEIAQIDAIQNLELLQNMDVVENLDLLAADVPVDEAHRLLELLPPEPSPEY